MATDNKPSAYDGTPAYIQVWAAIILAVAAGIALFYCGFDMTPGRSADGTTQIETVVPDSIGIHTGDGYEGTLDPLTDLPDGTLREAAINESVEPISPADYPVE